jgi:hypothetical protein
VWHYIKKIEKKKIKKKKKKATPWSVWVVEPTPWSDSTHENKKTKKLMGFGS